jgi:hypothetical protein
MLGTLYRYPHPLIEGRWLYVGQGPNRDIKHRKGIGSFGRRFKKYFPECALPQPVQEHMEVQNYSELNELETIWMFQYHTWHGYDGGMNLRFPGDLNYKVLGILGGAATKESTNGRKSNGGRRFYELYGSPNTFEGSSKQGRRNAENGHLNKIRSRESCSKGGRIGGRNGTHEDRVRSGRLAGLIGGVASTHKRFHLERDKVNPRCILCSEQNFIVAWG